MEQIVIVCGDVSYKMLKRELDELSFNVKHLVKSFSLGDKGYFYFNIDDQLVVK